MNKYNKYNAGFAPLVIVLIFVGVVVVGGGVYIAVKSNSDVKVVERTLLPSASSMVSIAPTSVATPTAIKTATPVPSKKPTVAVTVKYATVQEAVNSGKSVTCVTAWWSEKGPDEYRAHYYINGGTVKMQFDTKADGKITTDTMTTYTPISANYNSVLTYKLATAVCTQQ